MKKMKEALAACIENKDMKRLQQVLQEWQNPDPEIVMDLLDDCVDSPHVTAVLLEYQHRSFSPDELRKARETRTEKALGFLDEDEEDLGGQFTWERIPGGCRILSYKGTDQEVLIPEQIGNDPVAEISRLFFLTCASVETLLVPEEIQVGTLTPEEACKIFGTKLFDPEIILIRGEHTDGATFETNSVSQNMVPVTIPNTGESSPLHSGAAVLFGRWTGSTRCSNAPKPDLNDENSDVHMSSPIGWIILEKQDDRLLLLCRHVLEMLPFHSFRTGVLWDSCDLREWLNTTFYDVAFTEQEKEWICPVTTTGSPNPTFGTRNRFTSEDRVFLPSPEEWAAATSHQDMLKLSCSIWLRMPGLTAQYAVTANRTGKVNWQGELVSEHGIGFLPAICIKSPDSHLERT